MAITPITNLRGPAARITAVSAQSVAAGESAEVVMTGPDQNRKFDFKVPRGLPGVNAIENDEAVATYIAAPDSATTASLSSKYVADGDGVYYARRNGIRTQNTPAQNTAAWIALRNKIHGGAGATLILESGVYKFDTFAFDRENPAGTMGSEANITIQGQGIGTVIKLHAAGYGGAAMPIGRASYGDGSYRNVTLQDLTISTNDHWGSSDRLPIVGLRLEAASTITLKNIRVTGFGKGGIVNVDGWDMSWDNVEVLYCGTTNPDATVSSDPAYGYYAVDFDSLNDSCNAVHVRALRIEQAPLLLRLGRRARLMEFTDCKFEHGNNPTSLNRTDRSPILIDQALEVSFQGVKVTGSQTVEEMITMKPFIKVIPNTETFVTDYTYLSAVSFTNCDFIAASRTSTQWYEGSGATFSACMFARARGASTPFTLGDGNKFSDCRIALVNSDHRTFRINGTGNALVNTSITLGNGDPFNSPIEYGASAADNLDSNTQYTKGFPAAVVPTATNRNLGSNVAQSIQRMTVKPTPNTGGSMSVYGAQVVELTDTAATNWTDFRNAYNGQVIRVVARTGAVSRLVVGTNLDPNNGSSLTLSANSPISLINDNGVWRRC